MIDHYWLHSRESHYESDSAGRPSTNTSQWAVSCRMHPWCENLSQVHLSDSGSLRWAMSESALWSGSACWHNQSRAYCDTPVSLPNQEWGGTQAVLPCRCVSAGRISAAASCATAPRKAAVATCNHHIRQNAGRRVACVPYYIPYTE